MRFNSTHVVYLAAIVSSLGFISSVHADDFSFSLLANNAGRLEGKMSDGSPCSLKVRPTSSNWQAEMAGSFEGRAFAESASASNFGDESAYGDDAGDAQKEAKHRGSFHESRNRRDNFVTAFNGGWVNSSWGYTAGWEMTLRYNPKNYVITSFEISRKSGTLRCTNLKRVRSDDTRKLRYPRIDRSAN